MSTRLPAPANRHRTQPTARTAPTPFVLVVALGVAALVALPRPAAAQNCTDGNACLVNGTTISLGGRHQFTSLQVLNGGRIWVPAYNGTDRVNTGNLEVRAPLIRVDATSAVMADGRGYQPVLCEHGPGPYSTAGGRGGCAVYDSGGGGAHFGQGGRGTKDCPGSCTFPRDWEENCGNPSGYHACEQVSNCRDGNALPTVAGQPYRHSLYAIEFGAAGGDKGCLDGDGWNDSLNPMGGAGGGRVVLAGVADDGSGVLDIQGRVSADGWRGCGVLNDSAGGGAGGSVILAGDRVTVGGGARVSAYGGLGGDTRNLAYPTYPVDQTCPGGAQSGGTCDDCGGGGGGGVVAVMSGSPASVQPLADFDVRGAIGGVCGICNGEAGGGAGELQLNDAYVGEFCDGYDNDFDGLIDEGLAPITCGEGACAVTVPACVNGRPNDCIPSTAPECLDPIADTRARFLIIQDTSGSMLLDLNGLPTFGDGSADHPGLGNPSRLYLAKQAVSQVIAAFPEIDYALARFAQNSGANRNCNLASWMECGGICCSYDNPTNNTGNVDCTIPVSGGTSQIRPDPGVGAEQCINYAGWCGAQRRGADVLVGFGRSVNQPLMWLDHREESFIADTTPGDFCDFAAGGDCELRASGPTPLAGSLQAAAAHLATTMAVDPLAGCRRYAVILVTDGIETCLGDPRGAAAELLSTLGVETFVIGFSVLASERTALNDIAHGGSTSGTRDAFFATNQDELARALAAIVADSIVYERCNGADDDCNCTADTNGDGELCGPGDVGVDETFPQVGTECDDGQLGICRGTGHYRCTADETGAECVIDAPGQTAGTERCDDGLDNDCDGSVDEGCVSALDMCNGLDDDDDPGTPDGADDPRVHQPCGSDEGACVAGLTQCTGGEVRCAGGTPPGVETCNGVDDDCDGVTDGLVRSCFEGLSGCEPDGTGCVGVCRAGVSICAANQVPFVGWGPCLGEQRADPGETCDGQDNDCNGLVDEDLADVPCYPPGSGAGCTFAGGQWTCAEPCRIGSRACVAGSWSACTDAAGPTPEGCDAVDNDCDGLTDQDDPGMAPLGTCATACETVALVCVAGTPVCHAAEPQPEVCDGLDSDCDGLTDNNLDLGVPEAQCATACGPGLKDCDPASGEWVGCNAPEPRVEACDGLDNDCDGETDEDEAGEWLTRRCDNACGAGVERCTAGSYAACTAPIPSPEDCDGADNDCDGLIDGLDPDLVLGTCPSICGPDTGTEACIEGEVRCIAPPTRDEICNTVDDDCDGQTDEELVRPCNTVCGPGQERCEGGRYVGCTAPAPEAEACDGADNDCDGQTDEDLLRACQVACTTGAERCEIGTWTGCTAPGPSAESCDGLDNDCDNAIDEQESGTPLERPCATACGAGREICLRGAWVNCDAPVPFDEVCDDVDNDCDGQTDEDVTRACFSVCGRGVQTCAAGVFGECSVTLGDEVCDGVDNDCDGILDMLTEPCETACGVGVRVCQNGQWQACTAALPVAELCDGADNDCDGETDEPEETQCENAAQVCLHGTCRTPCAGGGECSGDGEQCISGYCVSGACAEVQCEPDEVCVEGRCVDLVCQDRVCPAGSVCSQGYCVNDDCLVAGCPDGETCVDGTCAPDACLTNPCPPDQACSQGRCFGSCAGRICPADQRCLDGACVSDPCAEADCPAGEVCFEGECFADLCATMVCPDGRVCTNGICTTDPCLTVHCPLGAVCDAKGQCVSSAPVVADGVDSGGEVAEFALPDIPSDWGGTPDAYGDARDGHGGDGGPSVAVPSAGCSCRVDGEATPGGPIACLLALALAAVGALRLVRRGRRRSGLGLLGGLLLAGGLGLAGCAAGDTGEPGLPDGSGQPETGTGPEVGPGVELPPGEAWPEASGEIGPDPCTPSNGGIEICDAIDNDCDGLTDENFHLESDPGHCGGCGRACAYPQAAGLCVESTCRRGACFPGYADQDGRDDNGCEVACQVSQGGIETCDGQDNDCNGVTDDGFDLANDPNNCGECGSHCNLPNVAEVLCVAGDCAVGRCEAGWADVDGNPLTGCEADCVPSNGGVENCDERDNDCDGVADDGFFLDMDPANCGQCGRVCVYDHAAVFCVAGDCLMGPCEAGYADGNRDAADGCEVPCEVTNGGIESCDELDNDCDGTTDDGFELSVDAQNCGRCGNVCEFPNAVAACVTRECMLLGCLSGFVDVDGNMNNGCEAACVVSNGGLEACDSLDNDCDGYTDEDFDRLTNPQHCGTCNFACQVPNATAGCENGFCTVAACQEGYADFNGVVGDGCEALCTPSNEGVEICDGLDNDCNGEADDAFDLTSDPAHCGACDHECQAEIGPQAVAGCFASTCVIGRCLDGFVDLDRRPETGCEYPCTPSPDGVEICDELDNNCDGVVDNGFDKLHDVNHCGTCPTVCAAASAQVWCDSGQCAIFACAPGFHDLANGYVDGCEYACTPSGLEVCDEQDNDCDGSTDEGFRDAAGVYNLSPNHCGRCGAVCNFAHASERCTEAGTCAFVACDEHWFDRNDDLESDGCEYPCIRSEAALDACDGRDDDCDGDTDEDAAAGLPAACFGGTTGCIEGGPGEFSCTGACHAGVPRCVAGIVRCENETRPTDETCDERDNDCDGDADEDFPLDSDLLNCGTCGHSCLEPLPPGAVPVGCVAGDCVFACEAGLVDRDHDLATAGAAGTGCEYPCEVTAPPNTEYCDGADNDCDGAVDEPVDLLPPPAGLCNRQPGTLCAGTPTACRAGSVGVQWYCEYDARIETDPDNPNRVLAEETRCDGADGDCDGRPDDAFQPAVGAPCDNGELGACQERGQYGCDDAGTATTCFLDAGGPGYAAETCDGLDNDCDGLTDEDAAAPGSDPSYVRDAYVRVQNAGLTFDIYAHEASRPDATAGEAGVLSPRACSRAGVLPWGGASYAQAAEACRAAGARLCSAAEWQAACAPISGQIYPYGSSYVPTACNGADYGADAAVPAASATGCAARHAAGSVFDLSGNLKEWTNDAAAPGFYRVRGGSFQSPSVGLACDFTFSVMEADATVPAVGFRCCRSAL